MSDKPSLHRGQHSKAYIAKVLEQTRLSEENQDNVTKFLCDGVRIKDLEGSKQQCYARIKKVIKLIEKDKK